jgi:hypothetical protein
VRLADEITGTHVLSRMYERYAQRGERIDLDGMLASLGVEKADDGSWGLDDTRPLAWIRHDIVEDRKKGAPKNVEAANAVVTRPAGATP